MDAFELRPVIEALLFAAAEPLTVTQLAEACEVEPTVVIEALAALGSAFEAEGRGVRLVEEAEGFILLTRPEFAPFVARLLRGKKRMRLSRPALETLAIIAYKQPVTKAEVDAIRGVDSSGVLNTLLERELVTIRGRSKVVGRPLLYGSTSEFLSYFGLRDLSDLPRVEELKAIVGEREPENPEAEPEPLVLAALPAGPPPATRDDAAEEAAGETVAFDSGPELVMGFDPALDPLVEDTSVALAEDDEDEDDRSARSDFDEDGDRPARG